MTTAAMGTSPGTVTLTERGATRRTLQQQLHLLQLGDSALPIGGFSFSNGLESAVQFHLVHDVATLSDFVTTSLRQCATGDGIALLCAHRAALDADTGTLLAVDSAVFQRKLNEETRLMCTRMGRKLCELAASITDNRQTQDWLGRISRAETPGTHPVSLALALSGLGIARADAFGVQQYGVATTILGAALRLLRVSFLDTQRILLDTSARVPTLYEEVADARLEDMASFAPMIDILAAMHVSGHVRLFMN